VLTGSDDLLALSDFSEIEICNFFLSQCFLSSTDSMLMKKGFFFLIHSCKIELSVKIGPLFDLLWNTSLVKLLVVLVYFKNGEYEERFHSSAHLYFHNSFWQNMHLLA